MDTSTLRLERYFFTDSTVRANPEHDPSGDRNGSKILPSFSSLPIADRPGAYIAELTIKLDEETSLNPPYFFSVSAFAVVVAPVNTEPGAAAVAVHGTCFNVLVGAIREHLAMITSRGPWGCFAFSPLPPPLADIPTDP